MGGIAEVKPLRAASQRGQACHADHLDYPTVHVLAVHVLAVHVLAVHVLAAHTHDSTYPGSTCASGAPHLGVCRDSGAVGRVAGEQVAVEQKTLLQNRDFPVLNEYRSILGGLFTRMYGLSPTQLNYVFAGVRGKDLALV